MRKRARRISCAFEKKKKSEELTKGSTGPSSLKSLSSTATRHPLPSGETTIVGPAGLGPPLPPTGLLPTVGPRQGDPVGLLPLVGLR
jgi:hypothetical protein